MGLLPLHSDHPPGTTPDSDSDEHRLDTHDPLHGMGIAAGNEIRGCGIAASMRKPLLHGNTLASTARMKSSLRPHFERSGARPIDSKM